MQNFYKVGVQNSFSLLLDEVADPPKTKAEKPDKKHRRKPAIAKNADPLGEIEKPVPPEPPKEDKSAKSAAPDPAGAAAKTPGKAKKKKRPKCVPVKKLTIDIPDEKMISLTDYMKSHCLTRKKPDYNLRQAGEGEDPTQWRNLVPLKNKKNNPDDELPPIPQRVVDKPPTPEPKMQRSPAPRRKHLDIPIRFEHPVMRKLRPYPPCALEIDFPKDVQQPPKVDDDKDFPSLGN